MTDATSFFLAFLAVFGAIAVYAIRLHAHARRLEERIHALEARRAVPAAPSAARAEGSPLPRRDAQGGRPGGRA